nr:MAG TPA: hypothetical protein [Caudoviricetes sp.]
MDRIRAKTEIIKVMILSIVIFLLYLQGTYKILVYGNIIYCILRIYNVSCISNRHLSCNQHQGNVERCKAYQFIAVQARAVC